MIKRYISYILMLLLCLSMSIVSFAGDEDESYYYQSDFTEEVEYLYPDSCVEPDLPLIYPLAISVPGTSMSFFPYFRTGFFYGGINVALDVGSNGVYNYRFSERTAGDWSAVSFDVVNTSNYNLSYPLIDGEAYRLIFSGAVANGSISAPGSFILSFGSFLSLDTRYLTPGSSILGSNIYFVDDFIFSGTSSTPIVINYSINLKAARKSFGFNTTSLSLLHLQHYVFSAYSSVGGSISPSGDVVKVIEGHDQEFTILPDEGYRIKDVIVDGVSVGSVSSYTFDNVQSDSTITAEFERLPLTISANAGSGGNIEPSGLVEVEAGSSPMFLVIPDEGYRVIDVMVDGLSIGPVSIYTFDDIQSDATISAEFDLIPVIVMQSSAGEGGGIAPSGDISALLGSSQTFTISPVSGYRIKDVLVNGISVGAVRVYTIDNIQAYDSIVAVFEPAPVGSDVITSALESLSDVVSYFSSLAGSVCVVGLLLFSFFLIIRVVIRSVTLFVG